MSNIMSFKLSLQNIFLPLLKRKKSRVIQNSCFFDSSYYLTDHPIDIALSGLSPSLHYYLFGWEEGRDPGPNFSTTAYLVLNPDVAESGINPLEHYELSGKKEGREVVSPVLLQTVRSSDLFDSSYYEKNYPDITALGLDPVLHYAISGWKEGRDPGPNFSTFAYLRMNPDIAEIGVNPLEHYELYGKKEGRLFISSDEFNLVRSSDFFDYSFYEKNYPEVTASGLDPVLHYCLYGWKEGRDPGPDFQSSIYLSFYKDEINENINPLFHFEKILKKKYRITKTNLEKDKNKKLHSIKIPKNLTKFTKGFAYCDKNSEAIPLEVCVSIIIPTKNAGADFYYTLEKIRKQKGIREIEIIIVDSGSEDETITTAEYFDSQVYKISPNQFNHGDTRNFGASKAKGDFLVFTVQDAIPIGDFWLHSLVKHFEHDYNLAALTCKQIPRTDADLFACFLLWYHYSISLQFNENRFFRGDETFNTLPIEEKRQYAGLENVCCCIKKDIFNAYKFRHILLGEDLDLGLRLLEGKYSLGRVLSPGVIHSHSRDPTFFLKRSYIDTMIVSKILGNYSYDSSFGLNVTDVYCSVFAFYLTLKNSMDQMEYLSFDVAPEIIIKNIIKILRNLIKNKCYLYYSLDKKKGPLDNIFEEINSIPDLSLIYQENLISIILEQYIIYLNYLKDYLKNVKSLKDIEHDFKYSLYKIFALTAGANLAHNYLNNLDTKDTYNLLIAINKKLCEGL